MTEITFQNFKFEVSDSPKPVLFFFYNTDTPSVDAFECANLEEDVKICKTNVEGGGAVFASLYGILSVPTALLLKNGKEIARYNSAMEEKELLEFINGNL